LKSLPVFLPLYIRLRQGVQVAADNRNDPASSRYFTTSLPDRRSFSGTNSFAYTVKPNRNPDSGAKVRRYFN
jgi:hypothetical protein